MTRLNRAKLPRKALVFVQHEQIVGHEHGDKSIDEAAAKERRANTLQAIEQCPTRAGRKFNWCRKSGYALNREITPDLLSFFSYVTPAEQQLSDKKFNDRWSEDSALARRLIRINAGYITADNMVVKKTKRKSRVKTLVCTKCNETFNAYKRNAKLCPKCGDRQPIGRLCQSGVKCMNAGRGHKPALAAPRKQYCTDGCRDSDKARMERAVLALKAPQPKNPPQATV